MCFYGKVVSLAIDGRGNENQREASNGVEGEEDPHKGAPRQSQTRAEMWREDAHV